MTDERRALLEAALLGFRKMQADISGKVASIEAELRGLPDVRKMRKSATRMMSAEGKAKIAAATRKRWAEYREKKGVA